MSEISYPLPPTLILVGGRHAGLLLNLPRPSFLRFPKHNRTQVSHRYGHREINSIEDLSNKDVPDWNAQGKVESTRCLSIYEYLSQHQTMNLYTPFAI